MDMFLIIRRKRSTIFTNAKESTTILEVKKMMEGILKQKPEDQKLFKDEQPLDDNKTLGECEFTSATVCMPAIIGLAFKLDDGVFEQCELTPYSIPPELPDVMKLQETSTTHAQEQTVSETSTTCVQEQTVSDMSTTHAQKQTVS